MNDGILEIIEQRVTAALQILGAENVASSHRMAENVLANVIYSEEGNLPNGEKLIFLRLYAPVVQREEVFLGNILFNTFLSKTFIYAVADSGLGKAEMVANDLENYFFLLRTRAGVADWAEAFHAQLEKNLPNLFFGKKDEMRGIYGDLSGMFTFRKSDFEPFPVYAIPKFLTPDLEKAVRNQILRMLTETDFKKQVRTIFAALAFFYGRTSGGSGDAQSFPNFVDHLVHDKNYDSLLAVVDVKKAFNIPAISKAAVKESLDNETYSLEDLRRTLTNLIHRFGQRIDAGDRKWFMGFLHKDEKFVDLPAAEYMSAILANVQLGYHLFHDSQKAVGMTCRLCNATLATIQDRYVVMGTNAFKRHNQGIKNQEEIACVKCALDSYLGQKLLGTALVSTGGKLPQVPKTHNLIFHYGKHNDEEIDQLTRRLDIILDLVRKHYETAEIRRQAKQQAKDLTARRDKEKDEKKRQQLSAQVEEAQKELTEAADQVQNVENEILAICPWLSTPSPIESCALDTLSNLQPHDGRIERHVLGLGIGGYRMILFILPQVRNPRDKEFDFAQRRFSNSRITLTATLAFLRELCGCDGPFYYQSLPALTPDAFHHDTFYIRNQTISRAQAQNEYELITQLAWKLIWQRGSEGFVKKVLLAEKLLDDPLGTLSSVMRDSNILGQSKGSFKTLAVAYRPDWKALDLTEYAKFIQKLSLLEEVK